MLINIKAYKYIKCTFQQGYKLNILKVTLQFKFNLLGLVSFTFFLCIFQSFSHTMYINLLNLIFVPQTRNNLALTTTNYLISTLGQCLDFSYEMGDLFLQNV